jgi:hypothetical protein
MTAQIALVIVGCVFSALLTGAIIYLRDIKAAILMQVAEHNKLKQELAELKEALPKEYVRREDWIMSFSKIEQKIDAIWEYIHVKRPNRGSGETENR